MGDVPGENVLMQWTDPNPLKVNYIAVMTGWGSIGYWEFMHVEHPRVIRLVYSVDTDTCLQGKEDWFTSSTCADAAAFCESDNSVLK